MLNGSRNKKMQFFPLFPVEKNYVYFKTINRHQKDGQKYKINDVWDWLNFRPEKEKKSTEILWIWRLKRRHKVLKQNKRLLITVSIKKKLWYIYIYI